MMYVGVYRYRGYSICTLIVATLSAGDELGYVIDDIRFSGVTFRGVGKTIAAINSNAE